MSAFPPGVEQVLFRSDGAAPEHDLMAVAQKEGVGFAISVEMSPAPRAAIAALPEAAWQTERRVSLAARRPCRARAWRPCRAGALLPSRTYLCRRAMARLFASRTNPGRIL